MSLEKRGADELRRAAERRIGQAGPGDPAGVDAVRLVHELQVHQVELELQNEELRASRQEAEAVLARYAELFDFAPIGYFVVGPDGRIREVNFAGARLLGVPRRELTGRTFDAFVADRDRPSFGQFLTRALGRLGRDDPAEVAELLLLVQPGGAVQARVTGASLAGAERTALIAVEDVTLRKRAEEALRHDAQQRDEFLASLSHELRNPLAPIRNGIYLLQRMAGEAGERGPLAVIDRQVTHLTRIVEDLLDVTRVARGKIRLRREPLELGVHASRTVEDHRPAFEAAGVGLDCTVDAEPCWVEADASRLAQALGNLLGNALKFTRRGGEVTVTVGPDGAGAARLAVRDTGVGIPPEALELIFEPFTQAPQTLDRTSGGLGLGLPMVRGLVELHGGQVEARSQGPGRGAEFVIRLPRIAAPAGADAPRPLGLGGRHRVLVIDDNADAATSLRDLLALGGHDVEVALDGPSGLAAAHAFRPEIVICDIGLPGLDGYQVARALRADPTLEGAWLVAISGYAAPEDVERAHAAGFDRHVAKPPTLERLAAVFADERASGGSRAAAAAAAAASPGP